MLQALTLTLHGRILMSALIMRCGADDTLRATPGAMNAMSLLKSKYGFARFIHYKNAPVPGERMTKYLARFATSARHIIAGWLCFINTLFKVYI